MSKMETKTPVKNFLKKSEKTVSNNREKWRLHPENGDYHEKMEMMKKGDYP